MFDFSGYSVGDVLTVPTGGPIDDRDFEKVVHAANEAASRAGLACDVTRVRPNDPTAFGTWRQAIHHINVRIVGRGATV